MGGAYRFAMQSPDGDLFHLSGEFLEIEPPRRPAYTFPEWVKDQLRVFVELTLPRNMSGGGFITTQSRATVPRDVVVAQAVVVEKILDRVLPSWRSTVPASTPSSGTGIGKRRRGRWPS